MAVPKEEPSGDPAFDKEMEQMKIDYQKSIPDKIKKFEDLAVKLFEETTQPNIKALRDEVHKVAGSAGSYGFPEVSKICKSFQTVLDGWLEQSASMSIEWKELEVIKKFLDDIKKETSKIASIVEQQPQQPQPAAPKDESVDEIMGKISEEYTKSIPDKIKKLEESVNNLANGADGKSLKSLREETHKIAGSAGTYGYQQASILCKRFVSKLDEWIKDFSTKPISEEKILEMKKFLENIKNALVQEKQVKSSEKRFIPPAVLQEHFNLDLYIADKDEENLSLLAKEAQARGLRIKVQTDKIQAVKDIEEKDFHPRMLIIGQCVPRGKAEEDHLELKACDIAKQFKEQNKKTIFGVITDKADMNFHIEALKRGIDYIIERPFVIDNVLNLVESSIPTLFEKPYKVLVLDDDKDVCEYIKYILTEINVEVKESTTIEGIYEILKTFSPQLLLLDLFLGEANGIEILKSIRKDARFRDLPIVLVTARDDIETMKQAYSEKVDDYLVKPLVKGLVQSKVLYFAFKQAYKDILQTQDPQSGLLAKRALIIYLNRKFEKIKPEENHSLVGFSIDKLEEMGKNSGPGLTEKIIVDFANSLQRFFRAYEIIGRFDNNIFMVFLDNLTPQEANELVKNFLGTIRIEMPLKREPIELIKVSGAIAVFPYDGKNSNDLMNSSENMLNQAKAEGGNKVICRALALQPQIVKEIFVLDDDADIQKVLKFSFEKKEYKVIVFGTIKEAEIYLKSKQRGELPNLLIFDRLLPDGDGLELYRRLKQEIIDFPPTLFLSKLSSEQDIMAGLKEGAVDYVIKPFSISILMEKALKLLKMKKK